jgi:cytochrome c biogenesis protein CcdA
MLSSITPLGERGRNNRFAVAASFFVAGSLLGGATIGFVAGALGRVIAPTRSTVAAAIVVAVALIGATFDGHVGGLRLPTIKRQVDERWLQKYRGWVYGFGFGAQLGTGVATIVSSAAVYVMLVAAVLTGSIAKGTIIGATFGLVRGASILSARRVGTPEELRQFHRRLAGHAARSERVSAATQGVIGAAGLLTIVAIR